MWVLIDSLWATFALFALVGWLVLTAAGMALWRQIKRR